MLNKILITISLLFMLITLNAENPKTPDLEKNKELLGKLYQTQYETFIGNKDAKVVIFDFSDYNCSDCKEIAPALEELVKNHNDLKIVFVDYPILRSPAMYAAQACIAALNQGKYLQLHNAFMTREGRLASEDEINAIAEKAKVDLSKAKTDDSIKAYLFKNLELGHKLGITNVPTLFIGNTSEPHNTTVIVEPKPEELNPLVNKYLKQ